jgi:hypothetical protein
VNRTSWWLERERKQRPRRLETPAAREKEKKRRRRVVVFFLNLVLFLDLWAVE